MSPANVAKSSECRFTKNCGTNSPVWRHESTGLAGLPSGKMRITKHLGGGTDGPTHEWTMAYDQPTGRETICRIVRAAGELVGVDDFAPHDMRRTYAAWLDSIELDIRAIRDLMRHKSVSHTKRYIAANPNRAAGTLIAIRRGTEPRALLAA